MGATGDSSARSVVRITSAPSALIDPAATLLPGFPPAYVPGWAILLSFGFSAGVGVIFGIIPAAKASQLDPIDALRYE